MKLHKCLLIVHLGWVWLCSHVAQSFPKWRPRRPTMMVRPMSSICCRSPLCGERWLAAVPGEKHGANQTGHLGVAQAPRETQRTFRQNLGDPPNFEIPAKNTEILQNQRVQLLFSFCSVFPGVRSFFGPEFDECMG